jgi:TetR/AcrR family transcriptional regulator, repressor of fatR-cypB operon
MPDPIIEFATKEMPKSKRALLVTGLSLFSKHGVDAISIGDISKITGFSRPSIFKFYKTKDAMAADIFAICYAGIYEKLKPIVNSNADLASRLTFFCELSADAIVDNAESLFMVSENLRRLWPHTTGLDKNKTILSVAIGLAKSGQQTKIVNQELTAEEIGMAIIGVIQQMARIQFFSDKKKSKKDLAASLLAISKRIMGM